MYQKELLEQYILNHPELEIDLDIWNMSKVSISTDFVDTLELKKKRTSRFSYYATSFIGVLIILLISKSHDLKIYNNGLNKTKQVSILQHINNNKISQWQSLIQGFYLNITRCTKCNNTLYNFEPFTTLNLNIIE